MCRSCHTDVPLAMYRDEIEAYKEAMCCEFADECEDEKTFPR